MVRSMTQRYRPRQVLASPPRRATRGACPVTQQGPDVGVVVSPCPGAACQVGGDAGRGGSRPRGWPARELPGTGCRGCGPPIPSQLAAAHRGRTTRRPCCLVCCGQPGLPRSARPLVARANAASAVARDQSTRPWAPSWSAVCSRRQNPAQVHAAHRRCAVGTATPNPGGRGGQAHPVVSTDTIAASTARESIIVVPPPGGRTGGTNGAANSHNSSGTQWRTRSSSTNQCSTLDHPQPT